jgi:CheY-like chemotaxis protein
MPQPLPHALTLFPQDDHSLNLRLITRLLQLQDFDVTAVGDSRAALDALLANAAAGGAPSGGAFAAASAVVPFDLAIIDMSMPVMSGPEAAAAFREWELEVRHGAIRLPNISLTANAAGEHEAECSQAGMDLFLSKPLRQEAIPMLRAHAAAHAEQRVVEEAARSATQEAEAAVAAAAAAAAVAHAMLCPPTHRTASSGGSKRTFSE